MMMDPVVVDFVRNDAKPCVEGCSLCGEKFAVTQRYEYIRVRYQQYHDFNLDSSYNRISEKESDFYGSAAVSVQHQIDHLNGVMFWNRCDGKNFTSFISQIDDSRFLKEIQLSLLNEREQNIRFWDRNVSPIPPF